jgi:hypothetical protein
MKKLPILMLSLLSVPTYAQGILGTLNQYQSNIQPQAAAAAATGTPGAKPGPEVKSATQSVSSSSQKCAENDQTSLPLSYVTSLIQEKNAALNITQDPRSGTLAITSADMIGNCSSMLQWELKQPEIQGKKAYAIEVKIKDGEDCKPEGCTYKVAIVEKGEFKEYKDVVLKPTLKGFEECLQKSGVIAAGKVVPSAIYSSPVNEKFPGLDYSGKLLFLSHGPSTPLIKAKYGKFESIDGCDYYEAAHPQIKNILTIADAERERLDAEASKLKECKPDEYHKLADFIDKYESYSNQLGQIRDKLILEAAKKSATAITAGKYTDEDLKVLQDFDRYVVVPKVERAKALYNEMMELEGDAKKARQEELKKVLTEIGTLNKKPYFTVNNIEKLLNDGKFDEAEIMNNFQLNIEAHKNLGSKQNNVVINPATAHQRLVASQAAFKQTIEREREKFDYKTGQSSGKANEYATLTQRMTQNIQTRNKNYQAEIQSEVERATGYCTAYYRNTTACQKECTDRIQQLQAELNHYNQVDLERAKEYDAKAKEYGALEAQGKKFIANQNGEEAPAPQGNQPQNNTNNLAPSGRPQGQNGVYDFNLNVQAQAGNQQPGMINQQGIQQQAALTSNQYMYPVGSAQTSFMNQSNPYVAQQGLVQQSLLGQQSLIQQRPGAYSFNIGGVNQGYAQQAYSPYQAAYSPVYRGY